MPEHPQEIDDIEELKRSEWRRRDSLCRAACSTVTILLVLFGVKDVATGYTTMAIVTGFYASTNLIAMLLYERTQKLEYFCGYLIVASCTLLLYLISSGGSENSGIVWLSVLPILMFSILTVRTASLICGIIFITVTLIMYVPNNSIFTAQYADHTKVAGLGAYALITLFIYFQSRERQLTAASVAKLNVELRQIASTDVLTHLPNRRDMSLRLEFECKRAKRTGKEFSIILCDIDYFKKVNDSFGHSVGDQALQAFSDLLRSRFRETDKVGRWGGEEFLAILPYTPLNEAITIANKVRQCICQASLFPNMPNRLVTMSAGIASSAQSLDPGELLKIADKHLYAAKDAGRNRVHPTQ